MSKQNFIEQLKEKQIDKISQKTGDNITSINDFTAGEKPSALFYILADKLNYLLDNDPNIAISEKGVMLRKKINYLIKKLGPSFLSAPQIIENRNKLLDPKSQEEDKGIEVPDRPVIWVANHSFKDDTLASILAADRNAYIMFGSLPQFFNTFDGITAWLNGTIMTNRKVKESKKASVLKANKAMAYGADIFIFPEGVWNKSPNELLLDFWPGVYRIAKDNNALVVPIVHYTEDKSDKTSTIHTVIDNPIDITKLSQEEGIELLREKMGTWYFLMMEKYGQTTREELLEGYNSSGEAWEEHLKRRVKTADRYDLEIELSAAYSPRSKVRAEDVFEPIANLEPNKDNIQHVMHAKTLVKELKKNDFQRRF